MKNLVEYICEKLVDNTQSQEVNEQDKNVWVLRDKDLDGAIFDVCDTEEDANRLKEMKLKENPDANFEIVTGKRSEFVKEEKEEKEEENIDNE